MVFLSGEMLLAICFCSDWRLVLSSLRELIERSNFAYSKLLIYRGAQESQLFQRAFCVCVCVFVNILLS